MTPSRALLLAGWALAAVPMFGRPALSDEATMRGIVRAVDQAWLSSDLGSRIDALPFREGERFREGDRILGFDCSELKSELAGAEARLRGEAITVENNQRLVKSKAGGRFELELARAKADGAAADVEALRAKTSRCEVLAPYDGQVAEIRGHLHERPARDEPVMQIVGSDRVEIDMLLPSAWLRWLKPGARFALGLDETGAVLDAEVARVAPVVDPVSQTVKVTGRLRVPAPGILPGMSGTVRFEAHDG